MAPDVDEASRQKLQCVGCHYLFAYVDAVVSQLLPTAYEAPASPLPSVDASGAATPAAATRPADADEPMPDADPIEAPTPDAAPDARANGPADDEVYAAAEASGDYVEMAFNFDNPKVARRVATALRNHGRVVSHNIDTAAALACNQCVEVLVTGPDATSIVYYITDYMTKIGYTKESLANQTLLALARLHKRTGEEADADLSGEERLRKAMVCVLNGAARGVTFGGPLVDVGARKALF